MRPLRLLIPALLASWCAAAPAPPPASPRIPPPPASLPASPLDSAPDPYRALEAWVDSSLADDRRLFWLRCSGATASRRRSRTLALQGVALFLAGIPVEYATSRHRDAHGTEPAGLNALGVALLSAAFWKLGLANLAWQDYQRDRACCRHWQEFAQINR